MKSYTTEKVKIRSSGGKIKLLVFRPTKSKKNAEATPGILWIHGGGYATGMAEMAYFTRPLSLVKKYGAVVVCVNYRLSTKAPYPAALEDCHAALCWMRDHASKLGISRDRLMVGGESAGGGLTAALCMYERDRGGVAIAYQMPLYPMLDDRDTDSSRDNHAPVWNTKRNRAAWKLYLKGLEDIPPYAAPARQTDYTALPPAYTFVGDIEPFYCETVSYAENLRAAGVEACADVYHGWFHAYDIFFPFKEVSKKAVAEFEKRYLYAAQHYTAPQPKE
ncbi:MAG: alpha/beta hydrolase [Oscillospiraceae bacterium]|nr:alpha/beta hydrolase [Oscillospiraceae bacterium]